MSDLSWIARRAAPLPEYFEPVEVAVDAIYRAGMKVDQVVCGAVGLTVLPRSRPIKGEISGQVKSVASGLRITGNIQKLMKRLEAAAPPDTRVAQLLLEGRIDIELVAA